MHQILDKCCNIQSVAKVYELKSQPSYEDNKRESDNVIYGKSNIVLFVLHILFVLNLVNVVSVQGKRPRRAQRQKHKRKTKHLSSFFKFKHDNHDCPTIGPRLLIPVGCSVIYNPSLVLFFLTPFPYIALRLCIPMVRRGTGI